MLGCMAVAIELLNSTKAAELIRSETGRNCSRQNLEKLCRAGRLPRSCISLSPIRLDPDRLIEEYLSNTDTRQQQSEQPAPARQPRRPQPATAADPGGEDVPNYNEERALHEREKRMLAQLARQEKEGELLRREDVDQAWGRAVNLTRTKLLGVPSVAKQRIPHLDVEEVEILMGLIREALEELATGKAAE